MNLSEFYKKKLQPTLSGMGANLQAGASNVGAAIQNWQQKPSNSLVTSAVNAIKPIATQVQRNITGNLPTFQQAGSNLQNLGQAGKFVLSSLTTPEGTAKLRQTMRQNSQGVPLGNFVNTVGQIGLRPVEQIAQVPYYASKLKTAMNAPITKLSDVPQRLGEAAIGGLGVVSGIQPFDDAALMTYDFLKGFNKADIRNAGLKQKLASGIQGLSMEKPTGLGEVLTTNPTGQMFGNLAELPAMLLAPGLIKSKGKLPSYADAAKLIEKEGGFTGMKSLPAINRYAADELAGQNLNPKYLYEQATQLGVNLNNWLKKLDATEEPGGRVKVVQDLMETLSSKVKRVTDQAEVQKIKNSIAEGETILRAKSINGRKLSKEELAAVERAVNNSRNKIGIAPTTSKGLAVTQPNDAIKTVVQKKIEAAKTYQPEFEKMVADLGAELGHAFEVGKEKGFDRAIEKVVKDYNGDPDALKDYNRATFKVNDMTDFKSTVASIQERFGNLVRVKDDYNGVMEGNFKKVIVNVRSPNGNVVEIQLTTPEMYHAKMTLGGHKLYEIYRVTRDEFSHAYQAMQRLYKDADTSASRRLNSSSVISLPSTAALKGGKASPEGMIAPKTLPSSPSETLTSVPSTSKNLGNIMSGIPTSPPITDIIPPKPSKTQVSNVPTGTEKLERGFVTSVKEAEGVSAQAKAAVAGDYTQKPNEQLMGEAKALLVDGGDINWNSTKNLDQKVAATIQEAINLDAAGNHEAAASLYNALSKHGTELGRGVQAFNMIDKMSPEAISLSAAGQIRKYNETHNAKIPELTGEQQAMISEKVKQIRSMLPGREKNIAINELEQSLNSFTPSTFAEKAVAVWKAGLLTSLRTHLRNIVGNVAHGSAEIVKDYPAAVVDKILAKKTGVRTLTATLKGLGEFGSKSTKQQMKDIVSKGFDPSQQINRFDYRKINWGKNKLEQGLKVYTDTVFNILGAADKPFYNAAFARSMYDQAGAAAMNAGKRGDMKFIKNLVDNPTADMVKAAISDANTATFKNKNMATSAATAIKNALGKNQLTYVLGEVTMPFTGVPTAVLGQVQAYSPIGLSKGIIDAARVASGNMPSIQRQASQEIGRGVVGTGIMALGAYLASKGLITGQPKDAAEARQWELENKPRNSIMVAGKWRSLNSISPEALLVLAGAKFDEEMSSPEGSMSEYAISLLKDQIDQSFLTGLQAPVNAITDPKRYAKSYVGQTLSSGIPNLGKDFARAFDSKARETNSVLDYAQLGVPGLRNNMVEKRDALGNVIKQEPTGAAAFFDIFQSKTPQTNPAISELSRLSAAGANATPGKLTKAQTIKGVKTQLTPEQLNVLEREVGKEATSAIQQLIQTPGYQALSDEDKADAIQKVVTSVRKSVRSGIDVGTGTKSIIPQAKAVETTGITGRYVVVDSKGNAKNIDLTKTIEKPSLTGQSELDKKLISGYNSDINSRISDIVALYKSGQISSDAAESEIKKLKTQSVSTKKPKKIKTKTIKMKKIKTPKVKVKKFKTVKVKALKKIKGKKIKSKKLTTTRI